MTTLEAYLGQFRRWLPGGDLGGPGGYVEGPNNDTPFGRRFGLNHQPWCLMFAMSCAEDAGLPFEVRTAGTRYCASWYADRGLLRRDPAPGALGLLFAGHKAGTGHAVTVEYLRADGTFATIEGNTDSRGGRTGGRVMRQARSLASLGAGGGFVHRQFDPGESEMNERQERKLDTLLAEVHNTQEAIGARLNGTIGDVLRRIDALERGPIAVEVHNTQEAIGARLNGRISDVLERLDELERRLP